MDDIKVYLVNVGYGNACFIHAGDSLVVFDCGHYYGSNHQITNGKTSKKNIETLCNDIGKKNVERIIFILSHPHPDHYSLWQDIEDFYDGVPNKKIAYEESVYKKKFAGTLPNGISKKSFAELDDKTVADIIPNKEISFKKTELKHIRIFAFNSTHTPANPVNDKGIMLYIDKGKNKIILPGDMSYLYWFASQSNQHKDTLINGATHIVIPHHIQTTELPNPKDFPTNPNVKWYACLADLSNKKNRDHFDFLKSKNATIIYTDEAGRKYLEIK